MTKSQFPNPKPLLSCLVIIWSLVIGHWSLADEVPVKVKADKLRYVEETGMIFAEGSAEVELKGMKIAADRLALDSKTNVVTAEGRVKINTKDYSALSDSVTYDTSSEVAYFHNFKSKSRSKTMRGPLLLSAKELTDKKKKMEGAQGELSTCDHSFPHYFMLADSVEYYPEDKIVGQNVTTYVGKLPVMWMPYLWYDLKGQQKRNWAFGHNEVEGDFVKSAWGYPDGLFYLDLMQKKGTGYGIGSNYGPLILGLGTLYLYSLVESDTGISDWIIRTNQEVPINSSTKLKVSQDYSTIYQIPSGRLDQTGWGFNLLHEDKGRWNTKLETFDNRISANKKLTFGLNQSYGKTASTYDLNYEFIEKDARWIRNAQRFTHQRQLWKENTAIYTSFNYYDNIATIGQVGDQRLDSAVRLNGAESNYSWSYADERYFDLDESRYGADSAIAYSEKKPEIELRPSALDLKLFSLSSSFGYGLYREVRFVQELNRMRDFETPRYKADLNASRNVPLILGTTLGLGAGILQYAYGPGDQLYAFQEGMSLKTELFSFVRNQANYERGYTEGNTPFFFDRLGLRKHFVNERLTFYYLDRFDWSSWTGFNYLTSKYDDLMTEMAIKPANAVALRFNTGWEIENKRYKDLVSSLKLVPYSFFSADLSATQDMNIGELKAAHGLLDLILLEGTPNQWHLRTSHVYDPNNKELKLRDIMVIKDLHCWEMKYTYSDYLKQFSLIISLKALPGEPVGFSSARGFYYDSFEKSLQELKGEEAVRRY